MIFNFVGGVVVGILSVPIVVIVAVTLAISSIYIAILLLQIIKAKSLLGVREILDKTVEETTNIPDYEPAVMAYLVNYQKIGKREICSTLFDLISRGIIKLNLEKGLVTDKKAEYSLKVDFEKADKLKSYEKLLVIYLFEKDEKVKIKRLEEKMYKDNLDKEFYSKFLNLIQQEAKKRNFFNQRIGKRKMRTYKIVDKFVTGVASIITGLGALGSCALEGLDGVDGDVGGVILITFLVYLLGAGILWLIKFLVSFTFNLNCYYNEFSKEGKQDYKKWIGFKKYLKSYSTIKDHPIMGVTIWERYYAYSIGLKCSKKFFKQMKAMRVVDNSIDIAVFETFNDIAGCIGTSSKGLRKIVQDEFGGTHVEY